MQSQLSFFLFGCTNHIIRFISMHIWIAQWPFTINFLFKLNLEYVLLTTLLNTATGNFSFRFIGIHFIHRLLFFFRCCCCFYKFTAYTNFNDCNRFNAKKNWLFIANSTLFIWLHTVSLVQIEIKSSFCTIVWKCWNLWLKWIIYKKKLREWLFPVEKKRRDWIQWKCQFMTIVLWARVIELNDIHFIGTDNDFSSGK